MRRADVSYTFGNCEVRIATREVLVDGRLHTATPKVFDLLAYLLTERHRAVSKQELIDELWRGAALSDSVLARTVMLARRLVGDLSDPPAWIQNVYGFGYRFAGPVLEQAQAPPTVLASPETPGQVERPHRIGLLPVHNQTQDTALAWTQVGLMALVGHALERDRRLAITTIGSDFLQHLPPGQNVRAAAREASELFGLDTVVHAVLRSQADTLWLDYQVFGRHDSGSPGSLRDSDAVALGERLARAIASAVLNGTHASGALLSRDAFVNQVYARAMECLSLEDWRTAAALLGAAGAMEPENLLIELERIRCLVWSKEPTALSCAEALLKRLSSSSPPRLLSGCHDLIAQTLNLTGDGKLISLSAEHRQKALDWGDQHGPADWAVSMRISAGNFFMAMGKFEKGRELLNRALADSRLTDNLVLAALCQQNLAIADRNEGNLILAKQRLDEALQICRRVPRRPQRGHALMQLALVNLHLGLFEEAGQQCDESLSTINLDQLRTYDSATAAGVAMVYLHLGRIAQVEQLASRFIDAFAADAIKPITFHVTLGCAAIGAGECAAAREHLVIATNDDGNWLGVSYRLRCLHALLHMEMAHGTEEQLQSCRRAFERLKPDVALPEFQAGVDYSLAAQRMLQGHRPQALETLMNIANGLPLGMSSQMAKLDAAWLLLEQGDTETAQTLISGAPTWRDAHPAGLALKARWLATQGRYAEAHRQQAQALARHRLPPHPAQLALTKFYEQAATRKRCPAPTEIPLLPRLLCATFVSSRHAARKVTGPST